MGAEQETDTRAHQDEERDPRLGQLQIPAHKGTAAGLDSSRSGDVTRTFRRIWMPRTTLAASVRPPVATWATVVSTIKSGYSAASSRAKYAAIPRKTCTPVTPSRATAAGRSARCRGN